MRSAQPSWGNSGGGHGRRQLSEDVNKGLRGKTKESRTKRRTAGAVALGTSAVLPGMRGLTPGGRKITAAYYGGRLALGAAGGATMYANRVKKADWMNIEEHKRRARDSRRTKSTGSVLLGGGIGAAGAILSRKPGAISEAKHIGRTARGAIPLNGRAGIGRVERTIGEAKKYPAGAGLIAAGTAGGVGAGMYAGGKLNEKRHDRAIARQRRSRAVSKARFFDPEHRRQRRLGAAEAALTGGAAAGLYLGGRGVVNSTRALRNVSGVVVRHPDKATAAQKAKRSKAAAAALKGISGSRRDIALLGGGTASGAGAIGVNRHAESRKGRGWN